MLDTEHVGLGQRGSGDVRQADGERLQRGVWAVGTAIRRDTPTLVPSDGSRHIFLLGWRHLPGRRLVSGAHYRYLTLRAQPCSVVRNVLSILRDMQ